MAANGISTLSTKQVRQVAKLGLAQTKRQGIFTRSNNGSILLDGTQYLTIPANSEYTLGTNDHTIEFWLYQSSRGQYDVAWTYCQVLQLVNNSYYLNVGSEGVYLLLGTTGGTEWGVSINPPTPSLNAWHHYAIVRYGNVFTLYVDGVGYSQTYDYDIPAQTGVMSLGKHVGMNSTGIPGYISNFRFVNGTAVYKQDFTPSEATLPNVPNTKILLNTVYGSNFLVDSSSIGATITNVGGGVSSPQYPNAVVTVDTTAPFYRARNTYDITQLPTRYDGNGIIDNPNTGGLVVGRPWLSNTNPSPVTQDLILFFDTGRTDCYPGTGTTIYNIVDLPTQTPSTIFGNVTFSDGILRIYNEDTTHPQNRLAGIECQTVTGFKTISLWYKQITSSAGYYSYIVDARTGMGGGWIYDTPNSDWFGGDWASGSMFIDGGATQSPTYTQQLNVWRNVTFVTNDTAFTDNITLFSRFTREEGLDVEFGAVMIYSRAITEAENKHNYDQFKTKYSAIPQVYTGLLFNYGQATISFTLTSGIFSDVTCPYGAGGYPYGPGVDPVLLMPGNQLAGGTSPANDIYWEYTAVDGTITGFTYRSGTPP